MCISKSNAPLLLLCGTVILAGTFLIQRQLLNPIDTTLKGILRDKDAQLALVEKDRDAKAREALLAQSKLEGAIDSLVDQRYGEKIQEMDARFLTKTQELNGKIADLQNAKVQLESIYESTTARLKQKTEDEISVSRELSDKKKQFEDASKLLQDENILLRKNKATLEAVLEGKIEQMKSIQVSLQPFIEYKVNDSWLDKKTTYKLGYQYQLIIMGAPVFSPAKIIIEEREEKGPSSTVDFAEKLAIRALELAKQIAASKEIPSSMVRLIPEVIKTVSL